MKKFFCLWIAVFSLFLFPVSACTTQPNSSARESIAGREVVSADEVNSFDGGAIRLLGRTYTSLKGLALETQVRARKSVFTERGLPRIS